MSVGMTSASHGAHRVWHVALHRPTLGRCAILLAVGCLTLAACADATSQPSRTATESPSTSAVGKVDPGSPGALNVERGSLSVDDPKHSELQVWRPESAANAPARSGATLGTPDGWPLVVVIPGDLAAGTSVDYLGQHLASWGYIVAMRRPGVGTYSLQDERNVVRATVAAANAKAPPLDGAATTLPAVIGLSSGADAALAEARDGTARAAVAMGAFPSGIGSVAQATVPALVVVSANDSDVTDASTVQDMIEAMPSAPPRYLLWFPTGVHDSYVDACPDCTVDFSGQRSHDLLNRYITAFLRVYVSGDARYDDDLNPPESEEEVDDPPDSVIQHSGEAPHEQPHE